MCNTRDIHPELLIFWAYRFMWLTPEQQVAAQKLVSSVWKEARPDHVAAIKKHLGGSNGELDAAIAKYEQWSNDDE